MIQKFSIDEFMIRIMPGSVFLAVIYFLYGNNFDLEFSKDNKILYAYIFFSVSFIAGELLQTIAHETERIINVFFKFRKPSKVFLYKNNPVLKNNFKRKELLKYLQLSKDEEKVFDTNYKKLKFWKINKKNDDLSQDIFWTLYGKVIESEAIKKSNIGYLFIRVNMLLFLFITVLFIINKYYYPAIISFVIFLIFLWRTRGYARNLIFKIVLLNINENEKNSNS